MNNKMPFSFCYYPTSVLMVDDNPRFLKHLSVGLSEKSTYHLLTDPRAALEWLNKPSILKIASEACFKSVEELDDREDLPRSSLNSVSLQSVMNLIYEPDRYREVSVLVLDYAMPGMNGLELCEKLKDHPVKKIMLTGEADHHLAVDAFNAGLIDRFLLKQSDTVLAQKLNQLIEEMQHAYFFELGTRLQLELNLPKLWQSEAFQSIIKQIFTEHDIYEYYLLNSEGSLLLLDHLGRPSWLLIEDAQEIDRFAQMAEENDAPSAVVSALQRHEKMPFFLTQEDEDTPVESWLDLMYSVKPVPNSSLYYVWTQTLNRPYLEESRISRQIRDI
ncbi:MAG: response regulator [Gammaproteobacteria bacterium]|nr:response regulator [Gammaproteobacteria bacterium]